VPVRPAERPRRPGEGPEGRLRPSTPHTEAQTTGQEGHHHRAERLRHRRHQPPAIHPVDAAAEWLTPRMRLYGHDPFTGRTPALRRGHWDTASPTSHVMPRLAKCCRPVPGGPDRGLHLAGQGHHGPSRELHQRASADEELIKVFASCSMPRCFDLTSQRPADSGGTAFV
jgi:hypothetical protein